MKFDELVKKSREIQAPEFKKDILVSDKKESPVKSFIDVLKMKDIKNKKLINIQLYILGVTSFIILGLILMTNRIFQIENVDIKTLRLGLILLYACYLVSICMFILRSKRYRNIDYNFGMIQFLEKAKRRYSYFNSNKLFYIPIIIFLSLGLYYTLLPVIDLFDINKLTLIVNLQIILVCIFVFDLFIKYSIWKRNQKPIYIEISKLLGEI